jgi:hypothetical protein
MERAVEKAAGDKCAFIRSRASGWQVEGLRHLAGGCERSAPSQGRQTAWRNSEDIFNDSNIFELF